MQKKRKFLHTFNTTLLMENTTLVYIKMFIHIQLVLIFLFFFFSRLFYFCLNKLPDQDTTTFIYALMELLGMWGSRENNTELETKKAITFLLIPAISFLLLTVLKIYIIPSCCFALWLFPLNTPKPTKIKWVIAKDCLPRSAYL